MDNDDTIELTRRMDVYLLLLDMESDRFARLDLAEVVDAIDARSSLALDFDQEGVP